MLEDGFQPKVATFTTLINSLCKAGKLQQAYEVFEVMGQIGCEPTIHTYNCLLKGLCFLGRVEAAYDLLLNIKKSKIKPDLYTYTAVMDGFCKHIVAWGEIGAGLSIYKEMLNFEFEVDGMMVNSLLRGLCRLARKLKEFLEDAYQVFVKMRSRRLVIDPVGYELVIESFCSGNKLDKAMECLYEIVRIGCSPKAFTFSNVIRVLCLEGDVDKALLVFFLMLKGGKSLSKVPFNLLINELNQQGMLLNARYLYGLALKCGVVPRNKPEERIALENSSFEERDDRRRESSINRKSLAPRGHVLL
ncbi:hypothetical protein RND71_021779 [Anisodus tanguticus]|uniref:Pentatricopeptide repeat-containing protein n=1 Tax=Anisodus tanguticus TaxID=243964 RepID=A0AAE1RXM8_9SOLA|nr:hypothetical protein RND71_021779 [Anisodus tanguticus]